MLPAGCALGWPYQSPVLPGAEYGGFEGPSDSDKGRAEGCQCDDEGHRYGRPLGYIHRKRQAGEAADGITSAHHGPHSDSNGGDSINRLGSGALLSGTKRLVSHSDAEHAQCQEADRRGKMKLVEQQDQPTCSKKSAEEYGGTGSKAGSSLANRSWKPTAVPLCWVLLIRDETANVIPLIASLVDEILEDQPDHECATQLLWSRHSGAKYPNGEGGWQEEPLNRILRTRKNQIAENRSLLPCQRSQWRQSIPVRILQISGYQRLEEASAADTCCNRLSS